MTVHWGKYIRESYFKLVTIYTVRDDLNLSNDSISLMVFGSLFQLAHVNGPNENLYTSVLA